MDEARPKVGVGLFLVKDRKQILLGKRIGSHGEGEYALPGGHLELGEALEDCALRELGEEAGLAIKVRGTRFLCATNMRKYAPKHYLDIGILAEWVSGEPQVTEPDKKEAWEWYDIDNLPSPLFGCTNNYVKAYRDGQVYFPDAL